MAEAAKLLVTAENPLILAGDVARDEEGMRLLVELAETLQAPVQGGCRGMPNQHPLSGSGSVRTADVILGLNEDGLYQRLNRYRDQQVRSSTPAAMADAKVISLSPTTCTCAATIKTSSATRKSRCPWRRIRRRRCRVHRGVQEADHPGSSARMDERGKKLAAASAQALERARVESTYGWDASPITLQRLAVEVWDVIKDKDWASVGGSGGRLWNVDRFYRTMGRANGGGVGGSLPIGIGGALAHSKQVGFASFQPDGECLHVASALWTATRHRIPMLFVMHNNRAYHQEG